MSPLPGAHSADVHGAAELTQPREPAQDAVHLATRLQAFLDEHRTGAVLEDGKPLFELESTQYRVQAEHGRCNLQLWSGERNLVRSVVDLTERGESLRLTTRRFGQPQPKILTLVPVLERRAPRQREPQRQQYLRLLRRVLSREFPDCVAEGFRAAMDLERSFGPAYTRGVLTRGREAWAVIGVGAGESQATIDGVLTLGILWLHHCRERSDGLRTFKGLRLIVPRGCGLVTLARLPWLSTGVAWHLYELHEAEETLEERDPADQGNLRTRLLHHPDQAAAQERFQPAIETVLALVPPGEDARVEQRLRSTAELAFLLHGLEFARARISMAPNTFAHTLEITVGVGPSETPLTAATRADLRELLADLFARRHPAAAPGGTRSLRPYTPARGIGAFTGQPVHRRQLAVSPPADFAGRALDRLHSRERAQAAQADPLFRAAPERWLESVLRENLAPLTRSLAPVPGPGAAVGSAYANDPDPDTRGNRASPAETTGWRLPLRQRATDRVIPRFDPRFVYTQVPAIAGASDRGMLDLLGVTGDGRLAVLEVKTSDDLQLALQGLDYWIRVRHHHLAADHATSGSAANGNDLQQHGYFRGVELSPLPPRLYLVAPALHIHPATETVLRYLSPRVEWTLLALDERWRQEIRVVWRKSGGTPARDAH